MFFLPSKLLWSLQHMTYKNKDKKILWLFVEEENQVAAVHRIPIIPKLIIFIMVHLAGLHHIITKQSKPLPLFSCESIS